MVVLVAFAMCSTGTLAAPQLSAEVIASELRVRFEEYLPNSDVPIQVIRPLQKSLGTGTLEDLDKKLQVLESERLLDGELDKLTKAEGSVSKRLDFQLRFYEPCVDFLAKLGRYVDAYQNQEFSGVDHIVRQPLAISKICKTILNTNTAKCSVTTC